MQTVLIIAGSDPSSGAGLQADLKTCHALGIDGLGVITAVTAQNAQRFLSVNPVKASVLQDQLRAMSPLSFQAIKIGMLGTEENVRAVVRFLQNKSLPIVLDPIFRASTGGTLLEKRGIKVLFEKLIPLCTLVTPNLYEAKILSGMEIRSVKQMQQAAKKIFENCRGVKSVLVKGGHLSRGATDVLYDGHCFHLFAASQRFSKDVHGTGCVLSTAIACHLAQGNSLKKSIQKAKRYVTAYIRLNGQR